MSPEVISLLSSPEPEPLPIKAPARTTKGLEGLGHKLSKLEDELSYGTVERIPESSNPGPSPAVRQAKQNNFWYDSDDFDTTGDLNGGNDGEEELYVDSRPSKRPRLSDNPTDWTQSRNSTSHGAVAGNIASPPLALQSPPHRTVAPADPIELSSSPVAPGQRVTKTTAFTDGDLSDSSNPFSSSPPRKSKEKAVAKSGNINGKGALSGSHPWFSPKKAAAWDPISSSAPASNGAHSSPPPRPFHRSRSEVITLDDSDLGLGSDPSSEEEFPDDLGKIKAMRLKRKPVSSTGKSHSTSQKTAASKASASTGPKTAEEKAREKEQREAERDQKRRERELAKEEAKKEKEKAKEQRAHEKKQAAALAEVNKIRTDKKVSTPEMLVDLPQSLPETTRLQAETLLRDLDVEFQPWPSPVENVVKWRRKVRARYNEDLGHWEPVPMLIEPEKHAMAIMTATQFVDLVLGNQHQQQPQPAVTSAGAETLDAHIARMKRHFPAHTLIYLIEGLNPWLRRNRTIRDRHFQAAVRNALEPPPPPPGADDAAAATAPAARRRKQPAASKQTTYVDEDLIEDALLALQVRHGVLVQHTAVALETARQVAVFTQHLSTVPYRRVKDRVDAASAGFCMDAGQVRAGDGPRDTYVRMLQEIARVTAPVAYGVLAEFPTVTALVRGLEEGGPLRLEDVRKCADREGTAGERRVGQAVSRRIWKVFTGRDETSMDV